MAGDLKLSMQILGAQRLKRAFETASLETRREVALAVQYTAEEVAQSARLRVPVRTGELRGTIRAEPGNSPFVWFVKAGYGTLKRSSRRSSTSTRTRRPRVRMLGPTEAGIYAMVVEFGSQTGRAKQRAQPYLFPALEASRLRHLQRLRGAIDGGFAAAARTA